MASTSISSIDDEETIVLELTNPTLLHDELPKEEILISTSEIERWNLPLILRSSSITVRANRSRLIQCSSYFRALLCGSFSESSLNHVLIQWNLEAIVNVLQFIFGCSLKVRPENFLLLLEGALFFGVEGLLLVCESWFIKISSERNLSCQQLSLDTIIEFWNFALEQGVAFVQELCKDYLARNFVWVVSCSSFTKVPYDLLYSCMEHPQLTVDSEKQICEALLHWISDNTKSSECAATYCENDHFDILKKVKVCLLPLGFAAGLRRCFSQFGNEIVSAILALQTDFSSTLRDTISEDKLDSLRIRITEYSEKIVLSGCVHMTIALLFMAVLPIDLDVTLKEKMILAFDQLNYRSVDFYKIIEKPVKILSFEAVRKVDISRCPKLHFGAAVEWLRLAFPSLRMLKASHCLQFRMGDLCYLLERCPLVNEIDLTIDISSVIRTKVSVISTTAEKSQLSDRRRHNITVRNYLLSNIAKPALGKPVLSSISKLTLEGRNDISDMDLLKISALTDSLSYINIKGCTLLTDVGISTFFSKCLSIHSMVLSYTTIGRDSILVLCADNIFHDGADVHDNQKHFHSMASRLQQLHLDGCKGIDRNSMSQLLSHVCMVKILSLRETFLMDDALCNFIGSSLESLDVSETMVSILALSSLLRRNPDLRCLKATGCKNLHQITSDEVTLTSGGRSKNFLHGLSKSCNLEDVAFGWGFSYVQMEELVPAFAKVKEITIGLGASLGHHVLHALPMICPLIESVVLTFQVISDTVMRIILESLRYLRVLGLHCCLGDWTSFSFRTSMPMLRILRLEWVSPWMTNDDLTLLTQNCSDLIELSLSGCKLLDSYSQEIISSGWPGLTSIHLEECGKITLNGVSSLFNCKGLEDLLLRHNGRGIRRNFIYHSALKLPLLRKVALDICDACEGGFDSPSHLEWQYISAVRISRCRPQRCGFDLQTTSSCKPVHKDTIILEWNSKELRTTIVKERI
ncbi:BTB/POZ domain-containing protein FBL11 isoform X2 [Typha latifolia]|uniref:BTB/POZ domain-containing protein FBL11 isoform X2 n=1 Tax=Typha latifolia TaxID=4733 RepID=UPI003C302214